MSLQYQIQRKSHILQNLQSKMIKRKNQQNFTKAQQLINQILHYADKQGRLLHKKYSINYLITLLDKNKIQSIDRVYKSKQEGFNLLEFVRFFLNVIPHFQNQTLYLAIGLVDLFKAISQVNSFTQRIKFINLTDFICQNILQKGISQNHIETKLIPEHKHIKPNYEIKDYALNPPIISGNKQEIVYKLSQNNVKIDKSKHDSVVTNCFFSNRYKKVFSLDALSQSICIYDTNCKLIRKLRPSTSKIKKDIVVLSFTYSQRQQRIGAVLKDFTLSFWDFSDNLQFQKVISTASHCQEYQSNIWYLQYFQNWITSDKTGTIYIWNLQKQVPERKIQCLHIGKINDLCQIPCLNLLAVAQEYRPNKNLVSKKQKQNNQQSRIILYNYLKGQKAGWINSSQNRIPHTLQYSSSYQVLLSAGFQKKINIFQINSKYLDTNLKGELLGHESLITNFMLVKNTPMVVSSDDKGRVKIWDIRNYKCVQTLDFQDKTIITKLLDMVQIGKLGVLGSRINFLEYDEKIQIIKKYQVKQKNGPIYLNYIHDKKELLVLTKRDIRLIDIQKGLVSKIYCQYHSKDEQIIGFKYLQILKKAIVGNEKGQVKLIPLLQSGNSKEQVTKLQGFSGGLVSHVEYDQQNKLFVTCGQNGSIRVQKNVQNSGWVVIRQMKNNFHGRQITTFSLSVYSGMIAIGSNQPVAYIWDYEYAQLLFQIKLSNSNIEPTAFAFLNGYGIFLMATSDGWLHIFQLKRQEQHGDEPTIKQILSYKHQNRMKEQNYEFSNQILVDISVLGTGSKQVIQFCKIYLPFTSGKVQVLNITSILKTIKKQANRKDLPTYNAERQLKESFNIQLQKSKFKSYELSSKHNNNFSSQIQIKQKQMHLGTINSLRILQFDCHYLVTCGVDQRVKIWNEDVLLCDCNVNLPLPYKWNIKIEDQRQTKDKIMFALKIIQNIFKKFGSDISTGQSKILKLQNFFSELRAANTLHITQPQFQDSQFSNQKQNYLFQKQFTKKDMHYDQIKKFNFHEIAGPSLRELDFKKKIQIIQKEWQQSKLKEQQEKTQLLINIQNKAHKNQEKEQVINFLQDKNYSLNSLKKNQLKKLYDDPNPAMKSIIQKIQQIQYPRENLKQTKGLLISTKGNKIFKQPMRNMLSLLKRSATDNSLLKSRGQQKNFEDYYIQKTQKNKDNMLNWQVKNSYSSLKQSRLNSFSSTSKLRSDKQYSFQNIIKDMNQKVKISRQNKTSQNIRVMANKIFENKIQNTQRIMKKTHNWQKLV